MVFVFRSSQIYIEPCLHAVRPTFVSIVLLGQENISSPIKSSQEMRILFYGEFILLNPSASTRLTVIVMKTFQIIHRMLVDKQSA